jgi:CheY-like chemotaxis protein
MNELKYAVICIDDDPFVLQMIGFQLNKIIDKNSTFLEFFTDPKLVSKNIKQLLNNQTEIIAILVDYQMPRLNGRELIREIIQVNPDLKFIMLSGQANDLIVEELVLENVLYKFVAKPWKEEELFQLIKPLLK